MDTEALLLFFMCHTKKTSLTKLAMMSRSAASASNKIYILQTIMPLAAGFILLATAKRAEASMLLSVTQEGGDVVVTGSGSINLSGLTFVENRTNFSNLFTATQLFVGPQTDAGSVSIWSGLSGPASIGTDDFIIETPDVSSAASFGSLFGIISNDFSGPAGSGNSLLVLPLGYISGAALSGTSRYSGQSLSSLGLTPGTQTWTIGSGPSADTVQVPPYRHRSALQGLRLSFPAFGASSETAASFGRHPKKTHFISPEWSHGPASGRSCSGLPIACSPLHKSSLLRSNAHSPRAAAGLESSTAA